MFQAAANSVRDLCEQDGQLGASDQTFHPSPRVRIEKIFGDHPLIRTLIGCGISPRKETYCGFEWHGKNPEGR
jgi:hypothetical protein